MSVANFIPVVWNAQLEQDFTQAAIAAGLVNHNYEGDAQKGNTVRVNTAGAITIKDYKTGVVSDGDSGTIARTTAPDAVSTTYVDLLIDQEKSFDFLIDDIDKAQAAGSMDVFTSNAGIALAADADTSILSDMYSSVTAQTAAAMTTWAQAWDTLRLLRKVLNKNKVPQGGRAAIINAEFESVLLASGSNLIQANTAGTTDGLRNAAVGRLLGFDIYTSENLPNVAKPQVIAFHPAAYTFASQVQESEAMRAQDTFADRIRGLHVYGRKAVKAAGIATFTAS
jgi:hypothetical protein